MNPNGIWKNFIYSPVETKNNINDKYKILFELLYLTLLKTTSFSQVCKKPTYLLEKWRLNLRIKV